MGIDFAYIKTNIEKKTYRLIGSGSGRQVYDLDNGYVVKTAKNRKGLAQNKAEYQIAKTNHSHIFAKIVAISEDSIFLIMKKAEIVKNISEVWNYYHVKSNRELFRINEFQDLTKKYNLLYPDLRRPSSWGLIKGKPVIIDYGFTREVSKYYTLF
jgi:hypothetical protein